MFLELSWQQWATIYLGAFFGYFALNWFSTISPKKFKVTVPEGEMITWVCIFILSNLFNFMLAANPRWKGKILENPTIRVSTKNIDKYPLYSKQHYRT